MGEEGRTGLTVRPCREEDAEALRALISASFGRNDEADLVDRLRMDGDLAHCLLAEHQCELTGAVVLSRLDAPFPAYALAPVAVAPLWQGQGIGSALVRAALTAAGPAGVFVLGDPDYYTRFGFSGERAAGYVSVYAGPAFMVHGPDDLPPTGRILYPQAFGGL